VYPGGGGPVVVAGLVLWLLGGGPVVVAGLVPEVLGGGPVDDGVAPAASGAALPAGSGR
jgi:hypothetical protein